jgi:hypothetical protein
MGVRELRSAFNEVASPKASCVKAFMENRPMGGISYQILIFSGLWPNGEGWVIQSDLIRPSGDLIAASQATARALLERTRAT